MAIEIIQATNNTPAGTTSDPTITLSNNIQDGDLAIAVYSIDYSLGGPNPPTTPGFTQLEWFDIGDGTASLWTKELTAADAGTDVVFDGPNYRSSLSLVVLRGADIDAWSGWFSASNSLNHTIPGLTTNDDYTEHLFFYATEGRHNPALPSGCTQLTDSPTGTYDTNRTEIIKRDAPYTPATVVADWTSGTGTMSDGKAVWRVALKEVVAPVPVEVLTNTPTMSLSTDEVEVEYGAAVTPASASLSITSHEVTVDTLNPDTYVDLSTASVSIVSRNIAMFGFEVVTTANIHEDVDTATALVQPHDADIDTTLNVVLEPAADFVVTPAGVVGQQTATEVETRYNVNYAIFLFDMPENLYEGGLVSASALLNYGSGTGAAIVGVAPILEVNESNYYNSTFGPEIIWDKTWGQPIDLTESLDGALPKGFRVRVTNGTTSYNIKLASKENLYPERRTKLALSYTEVPNPDVEVNAATATVSVEAQEPAGIDLGSTLDLPTPPIALNVYAATGAALASIDATTPDLIVDAHDATVEAVTSPDVYQDVATAAATLSAGEAVPVIGAVVDADDLDALTLEAHEVEVFNRDNVEFEATTPKILTDVYRVTDVNGDPVIPTESEDEYFVRTWETLDNFVSGDPSPAVWFRMNESGNIARDRAYVMRTHSTTGELYEYGRAQDADLFNVVTGLHDGPEGRHNFHFNGDAYMAFSAGAGNRTGSGSDANWAGSIEFTLRTTKSTQFIMGGVHYDNFQKTFFKELWLVDGVLEAREYAYGQTTPSVVTTGRTRLDDGKWHHIVWQTSHEQLEGSFYGSNEPRPSWQDDAFYMEFFVDGQLEIRRRRGVRPYATWTRLGGVANSSTTIRGVAKSNWFHGDMTELVFRPGRTINDDEISLQRDAVFGIRAVWLDTPSIRIKDAETTSYRGNKPRVLVLDFMGVRNVAWEDTTDEKHYMRWDNQARQFSALFPYAHGHGEESQFADVGYTFPGLGDPNSRLAAVDDNEEMATWFYQNVFYKSKNAGKERGTQRFHDEVTDNWRLVDLEKDINMDDFDLITITGFPGNDKMWAFYDELDAHNVAPFVPGRVQLENVVNQVKRLVKNEGKSLFINDPASAVAFGIVNDVDYVPQVKERAVLDYRLGANVGHIDFTAFVRDAWVPLEDRQTDVLHYAETEKAASRYFDTHSNIRQVVRNEINGLTTQQGYIKTDWIEWEDVNPFATPPYQWAEKFANRMAGLRVGDEFYMEGGWSQVATHELERDGERSRGWFASPVSAIKVGKAVTTFSLVVYGARFDNFNAPIGSPYYDHAISIAAEPGDMWDGVPITGKVYCNFTEARTWHAFRYDYDQIAKFTHDGYDPRESIAIGEEIVDADGRSYRVTAEMVQWQKSSRWGRWGKSNIIFDKPGNSDWGWGPGGIREGGGSTGLIGHAATFTWQWFHRPPVTIPTPTMSQRALRWLLADYDRSGNMATSVASARIISDAVEPEVIAGRSAEVDVATARITTESYSDADTLTRDISVMVSTPSAMLRVIGLRSEAVVETAKMTLQVHETQYGSGDFEYSEALVMTLPRAIETLILEDTR